MRQSGCTVPEWMLSLKNPTQDSKKLLKMKPIGRKDISRTNGAGTADDKNRERGVKRERVMGGKGGVFKRREGEEKGSGDKKGKKKEGKTGERVEKTKVGDAGSGERQAKKPRKGKVDMAE